MAELDRLPRKSGPFEELTTPRPTARAPQALGAAKRRFWWLLLVGPGLMVMLADSDAGSVITAAQSGAQYRYQLVACQLILIPVLYLVQEMTARLGLVTWHGHGTLIRSVFGLRWALLSAVTLFVTCVGALITEFAGLAGVGALVGLPRAVSIGVPTVALTVLVLAGRYRSVELVGIAIGALELMFIPAALTAHPDPAALGAGLAHPIRFNAPFMTLLAANVGAVIMPWMVFYQQRAVVDKGKRGLTLPRALRSARLDTALGSVITQIVVIAVVIVVGATIGTAHPGQSLNTVGDIADALTPFVGHDAAVWLFGLGMIGAAVVAALVVALAGAWGLSEVFGWRNSLNDSPRHAAGFYTLAVTGALAGAVLVLVWPNLIQLSVRVEVMNSCLLPIVLGFLLALERKALPPELRMRGVRRVITYLLSGVVMALGLYTTAQALIGG